MTLGFFLFHTFRLLIIGVAFRLVFVELRLSTRTVWPIASGANNFVKMVFFMVDNATPPALACLGVVYLRILVAGYSASKFLSAATNNPSDVIIDFPGVICFCLSTALFSGYTIATRIQPIWIYSGYRIRMDVGKSVRASLRADGI